MLFMLTVPARPLLAQPSPAQSAFRLNYQENMRDNTGPMPPGLGRGFWFEPEQFWRMYDFVRPDALESLQALAEKLLQEHGIRKDFSMEQSGGTPRNMRVVPGTVINQEPSLVNIYRDPELIDFLEDIMGPGVIPYEDPLENMVITRLEKKGDTHGLHFDVPPIALIICLEAPSLDEPDLSVNMFDADSDVWSYITGTDDPGGMLRFVNAYEDEQIHPMRPGDAYILRSDNFAHEVLPLTHAGQRRTILNLTYGLRGISNPPDGSAEKLFR